MITKSYVRKGALGNKKGWTFVVYYDNRSFPNIISALFKTKKEAKSELERYINTGDMVFYGSAE